MRKRILLYSFISAIAIFLVTCGLMIVVLTAADAQLTAAQIRAAVGRLLPVFGLTLVLILALSAVCAYFQMKGLIDPINAIDPENPSVPEGFSELQPLVDRIHRQNSTIYEQLSDLNARQIEFSAMTEKMEEGFILIGSRGDILSYNNSASEIFSQTQPFTGGDVMQLNPTPRFQAVIRNALSGHHGEMHIELGDRSYQVLVNPVMDERKCFGAVMLVLDVTERSQREYLRREFTANVSHELKTPLTSISGSAELMKSGLVPPEQMQEFSAIIYDEAKRLLALIEDIIRLSRLDEDDFAQEKELVDLQELCAGVIGRMEPMAKTYGVSLELRGERVTVNGIRQILDEMVQNLVENGIKYNKPDGHVVVHVTTQAANAIVSVSDTGIGIPAESRDRVFERFYRVDKSHSKETGGTGLGLSIVKHGAILHDARIELVSEEGVGTEIAIIF